MDLMPPFPDLRPLITLRGVTVTLHGQQALKAVDLDLRAGEHTVLRGGNGAGKSTLLRVLRGEQWLDAAGGGEIIWNAHGEAETSPLAGRIMTALISAAQQEQVISQGWDIRGEDLVFGGLTDAVYVLRSAEGQERDHIFAVAGWLGLEDLMPRRIPEFSQGELRLMLVARALVRNPAVLLLDEVTDGLDKEARVRLLSVLERVAKVTTLVISTHRPETLPPWMRREIRLHGGRILADGPTGARTAEDELRLSSPVGGLPALTTSPVLAPALGKTSLPQVQDTPFSGARVELQDATVFIDRKPVLHSLNWTIRPGENWAVVGSNGAGKSTLLRLLAGDETPAWGGAIRRYLPPHGQEVTDLETTRRYVRLVSDMQQATYGYNLSGEDLVLSGQDNTVGLYRRVSPAELEHAHHCLELFGVQHLAKRSIRHCSTGEVRRLLLARAIMGEPALLLLDEPCSGLDPAARHHILSLIDALGHRGVQFILVTHHDQDVISAVNRVLYLADGHIVEQK